MYGVKLMLWYLIWLQVIHHYYRFSHGSAFLSQEDFELQTLAYSYEAMSDSTVLLKKKKQNRTKKSTGALVISNTFCNEVEEEERKVGRRGTGWGKKDSSESLTIHL